MGMVLAGTLFFVSCDKNKPAEFDDADAFVAFDEATVSVSEDAKTIRIPVTLASVKGLSETVKFEISSPEQKGAKEGTNFELITVSGTLSFDAENRTNYIEIKPKYDGVYTGDLKFDITLTPSATVGTGAADVCTVTINDVDHPLSAILGKYTASGNHLTKGPVTWSMEILKDSNDDHKIWFNDIFGNPGWANNKMLYYGNVNEEMTEILVPFGQEAEFKYQGHPIYLYGIEEDNVVDSGSLRITIKTGADGKISLDFGQYGIYLYIDTLGWLSAILPGITAVKE